MWRASDGAPVARPHRRLHNLPFSSIMILILIAKEPADFTSISHLLHRLKTAGCDTRVDLLPRIVAKATSHDFPAMTSETKQAALPGPPVLISAARAR